MSTIILTTCLRSAEIFNGVTSKKKHHDNNTIFMFNPWHFPIETTKPATRKSGELSMCVSQRREGVRFKKIRDTNNATNSTPLSQRQIIYSIVCYKCTENV